MADIIKFPVESVRGWISIENTLKEALYEANASKDMINEICLYMKKHWEKYNNMKLVFNLQLPSITNPTLLSDINEAIKKSVDSLAQQIHELTNNLIFDLLIKEIELYSLRNKHPSAG